MGLVKHEDIPKRVFGGVLALLLVFFAIWSVNHATTITYCNKEICPTRFDFEFCLALFVLTACASSGVASLAYVISKPMVKMVWPRTNF
jgi:hypothetical protein